MPGSDVCATLRFSTAGLPEPARAQSVRDLHLRERAFLSDKLEPIEPPRTTARLSTPRRSDQADAARTCRRVWNAVRSAPRFSTQSGRPEQGDDLLLAVNVRGCSMAHPRDRDLRLGDGDAVFATRDVTGFILTRPAPGRFMAFGYRGRPSHCSLAASTRRRKVSFRTGRRRSTCSSPMRARSPRLCRSPTPELQRLAVNPCMISLLQPSAPRAWPSDCGRT
jgi:hypothetical protein